MISTWSTFAILVVALASPLESAATQDPEVEYLVNQTTKSFPETTESFPETTESAGRPFVRPTLSAEYLAFLKEVNDFLELAERIRAAYKIVIAVMLPLSLVTNALSMLVFLQKHRRRQTVSLVMTSLAVSDIFALTYDWGELVREHTTDGWRLIDRAFFCHFMYLVDFTARSCSSWLITLFTAERFISVRFPLKRASLVTRTRMRLAIALVVLVCAVSQMYVIHFYEVQTTRIGETRCKERYHQVQTSQRVEVAMRETFGFFVPSIITAVLNLNIVRCLRRWSKTRKELDSGAEEQDTRALTVMLVTVSTFSVIVYSPWSFFLLIDSIITVDWPEVKWYLVLEFILRPIGYLNFTCNFFFYCLGGRQFRNEFVNLVTCGRYCAPKKAAPSTKNTSLSQTTTTRGPASKPPAY